MIAIDEKKTSLLHDLLDISHQSSQDAHRCWFYLGYPPVFFLLLSPAEQCSKPLLVDDYRGFYYPIYRGVQ